MNPSRCWEGKNQEGLRSRPLHDIGIVYESHLQKNRLSLTAPFLTPFSSLSSWQMTLLCRRPPKSSCEPMVRIPEEIKPSPHFPSTASWGQVDKSWRYSILSYLVWSLSYPIIPIYLSTDLPVCLSVFLSIYLSIYLSVCLSIYLSTIHLSIYLLSSSHPLGASCFFWLVGSLGEPAHDNEIAISSGWVRFPSHGFTCNCKYIYMYTYIYTYKTLNHPSRRRYGSHPLQASSHIDTPWHQFILWIEGTKAHHLPQVESKLLAAPSGIFTCPKSRLTFLGKPFGQLLRLMENHSTKKVLRPTWNGCFRK